MSTVRPNLSLMEFKRFCLSFDHGHALVIGVGAYQYLPHLDVLLPVADAQALAAVLRDPQYCGYHSDQITVLADATATRVGILSALDALAARVEKQSTVLLFYSGHGHYGDDGTYYLTSHDTRLTENRKVLAGTAVSQRELLSKLQGLQAERVVLIFNACHAGEISPSESCARTPSNDKGVGLICCAHRLLSFCTRWHFYTAV
jgi:uncharacterized caspase-like protein